MRIVKWSRRVCAIGLIVAASAASLFAQSNTDGAIGGLVTDQQGASIPGATVIARNLATNSANEATTDGTGRFLVIRLQPGTYSLEVNLSGFAPFKRDSVVVEVG